MIIRCRRCDCNYKVPDSLVGTQAPCPECGAPNKITNMDVIDVEYKVQEGIAEGVEAEEIQEQDETDIQDAVLADEEPPWDSQSSYTVYINRQMEKNGLPCCGLGCLTFVLFSFLLIRGCMSLF